MGGEYKPHPAWSWTVQFSNFLWLEPGPTGRVDVQTPQVLQSNAVAALRCNVLNVLLSALYYINKYSLLFLGIQEESVHSQY